MTEVTLHQDDWFEGVPRRIGRLATLGIGLMVFGLGGFGTWATTAPLAAAVIADGTLVATGRNKIVQHLEGGIIQSIVVSEGDQVEEGDVLVRLDRTASLADQRELTLRRLRLEAIEARLLAEARLEDGLTLPDSLTSAHEFDELGDIINKQRMAFEVSRSLIESNLAVLDSDITSLEIRANGYRRQLDSHIARLADMRAEFADRETLADKGLIKAAELGIMRRAMLESEGQIARLEAEIEGAEMDLAQVEQKKAKYLGDWRHEVVEELQQVQAQLDSIREQARKADAVLERSEIVAPVAGTVVRLYYHSSGGVIETGKPIVEILPADAPLLVEIKVMRTDIDTVQIGQPATVMLSALNQRTTPVIEGEIEYVSADAIPDKSEGLPVDVYMAHVRLPRDANERVAGVTVVPGMPAQVMVQTETRTFFDYLTKPVRDSMGRAFREQ